MSRSPLVIMIKRGASPDAVLYLQLKIGLYRKRRIGPIWPDLLQQVRKAPALINWTAGRNLSASCSPAASKDAKTTPGTDNEETFEIIVPFRNGCSR